MVMEHLCVPIEFSLPQSLHFCTMLALPLPPFNGTLSWEHTNQKISKYQIHVTTL